MNNPIAFLIRPSRLLVFCMLLVGGYGVLLSAAEAVRDCPSIVDADDISPVELLD